MRDQNYLCICALTAIKRFAVKMSYEIKNKVFFVTGAATGIGADVVKMLAAENAKHIAVYDVNEQAGIALQNDLNAKYGGRVRFIKGDVTDENHFVATLKAVKKEKGLDTLINNAGLMNDSLERYKKEIEVNVTALVTGTLAAMELMRKDKGGNGGTVMNVASVVGLCQLSIMPIYFATKAAVIQFSNCIGLDDYYLKTGVRVMALCFGRTDTPLLHNLRNFHPEMDETIKKTIETFPFQKPEAAARGVIESFKKGRSASTWLITSGRPAEDITGNVMKAYEILSTGIMH